MKPFAFDQRDPNLNSGSPILSVQEVADAEILIIEDETLMSALMQRYLKTLGSTDFGGHKRSIGQVKVLSIESGWELLNADLNHVKVAIVDVLLPQVTGVDLIRDFRRRYPGMGLLPISGMATEPMKRSLKELLPEGFELLPKPLRREEFLENFLKAWTYSRSSGSIRAVRVDPASDPIPIESSLWSTGVSQSHPEVSVMKRKKLPKKAA